MNALWALRHAAQPCLVLLCSVTAFEASAAYTCSISATSISTVYSPSVATPNDSVGSYTISCTRTAGDPNTLDYNVDANNGTHSGMGSRRVQLGATANRYSYSLYRNAGFSQAWGTTGPTDINGTLNFGASLSASFTGPFYLRVPQDATPGPAGTYTDTVTVTLSQTVRGPDPLFASTTFGVSVITTNSCQISVPPGNINFTYTSFQAAPSTASSTYGVRCTLNLPYAMGLDGTLPYIYSLLGLTYTLAVPAGATGTGFTQSHTIIGSIPASQSGTCATAVCTGTQTRTLMITY